MNNNNNLFIVELNRVYNWSYSNVLESEYEYGTVLYSENIMFLYET